VAGGLRNSGWALAGLLLLALPARGQIRVGEVSSDMNGIVSVGYNGDYGNQISSDHSLSAGGSGTLAGYYYNPNFLSFVASPYLNQARDNSAYQSISNASGVTASANIFSGSHFPGSINYAKAYNSEGNFAIPGVANYTTHGNSDTFGINWAVLLPGLPTLSASFQSGSSQYSIYGANDSGSSASHSFMVRSGYTLAGFNLSAFFTDGGGHSEIPEVLQDSQTSEYSSSSDRAYGFTVGHPLPFHGTVAGAITSSHYDSEFEGGSNSGTFDNYSATTLFQPTNKTNVSFSTSYATNLSGSLSQAIATSSGGVAPIVNLGAGTHSLDMTATAGYSLMANMQTLAFADHREQYYLGENFSSSSYGGSVTYWRPLFGGSLNTALTLSDNTSSTTNANNLGINSTVNYNRRFSGEWAASASFGYSQNVQSQLITYTTSAYSYGANVRKRWKQYGWTGGASVSRTLLTEVAGSSNVSESFMTAVNFSHWITANGNYSKATGTAIQAGVGLVQNPVPQPLIPGNDLILFGGNSYSFGLSSNPQRKLTLGASYAKSITNSNLQGVLSENNTKMINALFTYQVRKMYVTGGYSNIVQGFSVTGTAPENVSSFYIGISRWFNFF
jgi:hypothetical protein